MTKILRILTKFLQIKYKTQEPNFAYFKRIPVLLIDTDFLYLPILVCDCWLTLQSFKSFATGESFNKRPVENYEVKWFLQIKDKALFSFKFFNKCLKINLFWNPYYFFKTIQRKGSEPQFWVHLSLDLNKTYIILPRKGLVCIDG